MKGGYKKVWHSTYAIKETIICNDLYQNVSIYQLRFVYLIFLKCKYWKFYFLNLYTRFILTTILRKSSEFSLLNTDFQLYFAGITLQTTICFILSFFIFSLKAIMLSIDNSFPWKIFLKSFKSWSCKQLLKYNLYIVLHIANCELLFKNLKI